MDPDVNAADVAVGLGRVTAALAGREDRPGQLRMAELVADAIRTERHLVVQAGTGTGKTLAYLVPVILLGERCGVATSMIASHTAGPTTSPFRARSPASLGLTKRFSSVVSVHSRPVLVVMPRLFKSRAIDFMPSPPR